MSLDFEHVPVLLEEVISHLCLESYSVFVDATVGLGGHAYHILERLKEVRLIGIDVDEEALEKAEKRLRKFRRRVSLFRENFLKMERVLTRIGIDRIDAVLFDLGVSSLQLAGKRGFSFADEAFLDMRMDRRAQKTAYEVVNHYSYESLLKVIRDFGEEEEAERIVRAIVEERKRRPIETARELARIVEGAKKRRGRLHPATKTFQAIRIEVNDELSNLKGGLAKAWGLLRPGGRMGVISFHSLEDRIVKGFMRTSPYLVPLTRTPVRPTQEEIRTNPRSRSAKLRVAEKTDGIQEG